MTSLEFVRKLVAAGVGTAAPGEDPGTEPEVLAAVNVALDLGGDLNGVDDKDQTVMHGAAYKHLPAVVTFLAGAGADVSVWNQPNAKDWTPLDIVAVHLDVNRQRSPQPPSVKPWKQLGWFHRLASRLFVRHQSLSRTAWGRHGHLRCRPGRAPPTSA